MLIIAATPIGNLGDASPRLRQLLEDAQFIAAEDTRSLKQLAGGLGVKLHAKLISLHEHNEAEKLAELVEIARSHELVLVSDAGMPTVSDPGFQLVRAIREAEIEVTVVPGPSAVLSALAASGLPTDRFCFEGFLPRKSSARLSALRELRAEKRTMVFFEAPHRILASLQDAATVFGTDRLASVSREISKKFEHTEHGTLGELVEWAKTEPRGEMVLVVAGNVAPEVDAEAALAELAELVAAGTPLRQAAAEVASATGLAKNWLYSEALRRRG